MVNDEVFNWKEYYKNRLLGQRQKNTFKEIPSSQNELGQPGEIGSLLLACHLDIEDETSGYTNIAYV